ncbi:MAG: cell division protein FtsA [Candidatus Magasanikbacteria bacterium]|nr:cell division protein FtsA [Candidatus Magasanikbacteria bacterium]MBT4072054.1 cell division protein FtsA [Candidatus Magasanikbacteria bacterium]
MVRSNMQTNIIAGIDIGSTAIRVAIGQYVFIDGQEPEVQIIGTAEVSSGGMHRGTITSIEEVVSSVSHVLEEAERLVGVPIEHAWIGICGAQILSQESRGVVAVAKSDGEISYEDVARVVEAAQTVAAPLNYEVLHILPKTFTVDGQIGVKDPVGMTGVRLEVDAQMIYGVSAHIKNISKAVYRTGIDIDDLVLSVVATADIVLTSRQKDLGVVMVDVGGSTTTIAVYEEGNMIHSSVIPIGSNHITNDLALGLQTSIDIAERLKVTYGQCTLKGVTSDEIIDLAEFGAESQPVSKAFMVEIISARVSELMEKINDELLNIERKALLPAGVIFAGGGAKLRGLTDIAKQVLHVNAAHGYPHGVQSATDKINDLAYTGAIGLVKWGALMDMRGGNKSIIRFPGGKQMAVQVKKLFKFLVP